MVDREKLKIKCELYKHKRIAMRCLLALSSEDGAQPPYESECREFRNMLLEFRDGTSESLKGAVDPADVDQLIAILDTWLVDFRLEQEQRTVGTDLLGRARRYFTEQYRFQMSYRTT